MKLAIAVISNRDHKPAFTESLVNLIGYTIMKASSIGLESYDPIIGSQWSALPNGRQNVVNVATDRGNTHILCIDDDMKFPANSLEILASRKVQAIGVNAVTKSSKLKFTAYTLKGEMIDSRGKTGIEEVKFCGLGMFLLDLRILKEIPQPHFEMPWNAETNECDAEDFILCRKLREHGHKVYVDHDVSQGMGHIGDYIYTLNSYS